MRTGKVLSILLALVLCLSLAAPVLAAEEETAGALTNKQLLELLPSQPVPAVAPQQLEQAAAWRNDPPWELSESEIKAEEEIFREIVTQAKNVVRGKTSETQKARAICEWVADNISYDDTAAKYRNEISNGRALTEQQEIHAFKAGDALYTFHLRSGVCEGYADLANLMLAISGFPTAYFAGDSHNDGFHAWSAVYADGRWIMFDATWRIWDISQDYHKNISVIRYTEGAFWACGDSIESADDFDWYRMPFGDRFPAEVVIPDALPYIDDNWFSDYKDLTAIEVRSGNPNYASIDGVLFTKDMKKLMAYPAGKQGSYDIPHGVTTIAEDAFRGCTGLTSVIIPASVTTIREAAFFRCTGLTSVTIPKSVTRIDDSAFRGCTSLTGVQVDAGNTHYASIGEVLFTGDKETLLAYPGGKQGDYSIPYGVTTIAEGAFFHCTGLTSVTIPESVTRIDSYAFSDCTSLTSVTIPASVKSIDSYAFSDCTGLTSVTIPASVKSIKKSAFSDCTSLKDVYYGGTEEQWAAIKLPIAAAKHYNSAMPGQPAAQTGSASAVPTSSKVLVNGQSVTFDAYNIGGSNYFKLRDLASVLSGTARQFEVSYDKAANAIVLASGSSYTAVGGEMAAGTAGTRAATPTSSKILLDGKDVSFDAYNIGGSNYFKLRDIGRTFDFGVGWDNAGRTITIDTSTAYTD